MKLKTYSDSTLMRLPKKELIEYIRMVEHNYEVVSEQLDNQYAYVVRNCVTKDELKKKYGIDWDKE